MRRSTPGADIAEKDIPPASHLERLAVMLGAIRLLEIALKTLSIFTLRDPPEDAKAPRMYDPTQTHLALFSRIR